MIEQRTFDWHRQRLGKFTGSKVADLMTKSRTKGETFGGTAMSYIRKIAFQRMMNPAVVEDDELLCDYLELVNPSSRAMRWGTEQEEEARALYVNTAGNKVIDVSSVEKAGMPYFAASPDGVVIDHATGELGVLEIKCLLDERFVEFLAVKDADTLKQVDAKYYWQVMAEMAVTGYEYCDFVTYNPFAARPLHVARIARNNDDIADMLERVQLANELCDSLTA